jgi:hypothetical protein
MQAWKAVAPAALLVASLLSLHSSVGDAAVDGGRSGADLLRAAAAVRPVVHRLRGGELGGGAQVSPVQVSTPHSSTRRDMYSSEMRGGERMGRQSTVHFESSHTKDETQSYNSPLPEHLKALKKQLEQQRLKDFTSPVDARAEGFARELDLSTPMAPSGDAVNRAFASLSKAAGTPYKTPVKGWPARFRHELELLKTAMETYSASQQEAMQSLVKEKERSSALEEQKTQLEKTMQDKLAEMERVKSLMEKRASETEERLQALRQQMDTQEQQDTQVSEQLANLEAAKAVSSSLTVFRRGFVLQGLGTYGATLCLCARFACACMLFSIILAGVYMISSMIVSMICSMMLDHAGHGRGC